MVESEEWYSIHDVFFLMFIESQMEAFVLLLRKHFFSLNS